MPDVQGSLRFSICICTYKRTQLLSKLISDLFMQCAHPQYLIIVDGDPSSGEVVSLLKGIMSSSEIKATYVPSNHGNLSYQRYLGWKTASNLGCDFLLYLDDDLRIYQCDAIQNLLAPMIQEGSIVGTTSHIHFGAKTGIFITQPSLTDVRNHFALADTLIRIFGSAKSSTAGEVTPIGDKIPPSPGIGDPPVSPIKWLHGGVMCYRLSSMSEVCFSNDLFALDQIRCGKGEDTFLSRRVMIKGNLVYISSVTVEHPNEDLPITYPIDGLHLAYATAYSRRFLNDHYRITEPPHFSDRLALLRSYFGNNLLNILHAVRHPARHRFAYAWGYFLGSARGVFQKPTSKNLTPQIDWYKDAEEALSHAIEIL